MATAATPEQAIRDELAQPLGTWVPFGEPSAGGVQAGTYRGGRADVVDLATVRFVKQRTSARRRVVAVTYAAVNPRWGPEPMPHRGIYPLESDGEGGWRTIGHSGGGGTEPHWTEPRVNLGGGELPGGGVYAGGTVHGAGCEVARVELRFPDGTVLADDADEDMALFIADDDLSLEATVVLLDATGAEVGRHPAFPT